MTSLASFFDSLKQVPLVLAAITLATLVHGWWQKTLGRRRLWKRNFLRLAVGIHPEFVKELFGAPAFEEPTKGHYLELSRGLRRHQVRRRDVDLVASTWVLSRDGYLMTWAEGERVVAYSLTTASSWFTPQLPIGPVLDGHKVHLGRSHFAQVVPDYSLKERLGWVGARRYGYWEQHYWGNPGNYLYWYLGFSECGYAKHWTRPRRLRTRPPPRRPFRSSAGLLPSTAS
ncbi:ETEC_3214 domain-containing protein [Streptomyces olivoreticuli]